MSKKRQKQTKATKKKWNAKKIAIHAFVWLAIFGLIATSVIPFMFGYGF